MNSSVQPAMLATMMIQRGGGPNTGGDTTALTCVSTCKSYSTSHTLFIKSIHLTVNKEQSNCENSLCRPRVLSLLTLFVYLWVINDWLSEFNTVGHISDLCVNWWRDNDTGHL